MSLQKQEQGRSESINDTKFVLPFAAVHRDMLALVGGKAANLGEMAGAGLPVPPGFCITTAAYQLVASQSGLEVLLAEKAASPADDASLAEAARARLLAASIPASVAEAIVAAYRVLGSGEPIPVAVRSSATAEDLPFASFAGQQDTYLNVVGIEALLEAVRHCWASLWTDRAVSYRASLGIDQRSVQLAVVVQRQIASEVAGVLFTANPLTGKRRQAVIDANPGLGEAVVSGATNPDHFVVNTASGEIVERRPGDKRLVIRGAEGGGTVRTESSEGSAEFCLSDEQIRALAALGARVEAHYRAPQDTEWAIDASGQLWLLQARPITTLYPLPTNAPDTDDVLRVYISLNIIQGVYRPFTPMGISAFRLVGGAFATNFGLPPRDLLSGPPVMVDAGSRIFLDVTTPLRTSFGRTLLIQASRVGEARSTELLEQLTHDPRLSVLYTRLWPFIRTMLRFAEKTRAPLNAFRALSRPKAAVARVEQVRKQVQELDTDFATGSAADRLTTMEQFFPRKIGSVIGAIAAPVFAGIFGSYFLVGRLLKDLATPDEMQIVLRALPHNPTTEMDLELWALAQRLQVDPQVVQRLQETPPEQLAQDYRAGTLPSLLQRELEGFLHIYGHRGVAEIDIGLPRWSEDPTHILGVLTNYLQLKNPDLAPDVQFRRGAQEAEAMVAELIRRAHRKGWLRGQLVRFLLKRVRILGGLREMPKFCLVLILAQMRKTLWSVGQELAEAGQLETAADIFFITLQEAHAALAGEDMRQVVRERHAAYDFEMRRRHVPRVLLSDGTEPAPASSADPPAAESQHMLRGAPASPGRITAQARVILDPTGARLEPGEILVAPSTDPGWTPLFLTAGGLVMEMGGMMSHGAVVAREYGIPAVVGVPDATNRITTGQQITVDGAAGTVTIEDQV